MRSLVVTALTAVALATPIGVAAAAPKAPTCDGLTATIVGTQADDTIAGTTGDDVIVGLGGDDVIVGDLGADRICGGTGDDTLSGHGDSDYLFGDQGDDLLDGGVGGCCDVASTPATTSCRRHRQRRAQLPDFPTTGNTMHGDQVQGRPLRLVRRRGVRRQRQGRALPVRRICHPRRRERRRHPDQRGRPEH